MIITGLFEPWSGARTLYLSPLIVVLAVRDGGCSDVVVVCRYCCYFSFCVLPFDPHFILTRLLLSCLAVYFLNGLLL